MLLFVSCPNETMGSPVFRFADRVQKSLKKNRSVGLHCALACIVRYLTSPLALGCFTMSYFVLRKFRKCVDRQIDLR